ncbi:hypothetical protein GCM10011578_070760 [Streptomyces fuscichromogenes]|uniref:Uncharacterized protein n=1 Tax=Streptomyces fuscichromogenes TaxID=1324013 RepID=A0A918CUY6_9ACTN|nr:hypothetical protein GCM10011578_070760 [Streptomyces fuscichromogenes]
MAFVITVLGFCPGSASSTASMSTPPATGDALTAAGPPAFGILGYPHAKVGMVWRFAFPLFVNRSRTTVRITSVRLDHVPSGARVEGYSVYSAKDTDGYILDSMEGDKNVPGSRDMTTMPDYSGRPLVIRGHADSGDYYAMVRVRVVGRIREHLSGCRVNYTQGGNRYTQEMHCEYALDMK